MAGRGGGANEDCDSSDFCSLVSEGLESAERQASESANQVEVKG